MDIAVEKYIFDSIGEGFKAGFVEVKFPDEGYPRFLTFSNESVRLHSCGSSEVIWHFAPGEIVADLEHISILSSSTDAVELKFQTEIKVVPFSINSHGVYWGR
ncbi:MULTISPECIES: hypothetical protein [unclassified Pseudoalteromonas]|uniref:hypothetical protein n=1 Tax=unclassified Pseudoalteromonas TaxID=194690 RepID=UPI0016040245|nr:MULTISPECIES: hypothetical protein [unclassified Pseudoalteromonas]MBB1297319.1 hypothetical protein [Pseudoalteromonas sp. SR41-7]MBB1445512.1 hypothetical protein [Pseudoalteromonas sp. SG43-3]|tara:strand:- start:21 stop:329 length:309 start_codon:yes stop_codon:yes gene_type:complete